MNGDPYRVLIDSCAVNRFALINLDPGEALAGRAFRLAVTPQLAREYRRALDHLFVPSYVKALIQKLLRQSEMLNDAEGDASETDDHLVALSTKAIVITDDAKQYRRWRGTDHPGLLAWPDVEAHLKEGLPLVALLERVSAVSRRGKRDQRNEAISSQY